MARPAPPPDGRRLSPGRVLSDHLLLRWCQQSTMGETRVASPASLAIAPALASDLTRSAVALDANDEIADLKVAAANKAALKAAR